MELILRAGWLFERGFLGDLGFLWTNGLRQLSIPDLAHVGPLTRCIVGGQWRSGWLCLLYLYGIALACLALCGGRFGGRFDGKPLPYLLPCTAGYIYELYPRAPLKIACPYELPVCVD